MDNIRERAKLFLEPVEGRGVDIEDRLERDAHVALPVVSFINDAHSPGADASTDCEAIGADEVVDLSRYHHALHKARCGEGGAGGGNSGRPLFHPHIPCLPSRLPALVPRLPHLASRTPPPAPPGVTSSSNIPGVP